MLLELQDSPGLYMPQLDIGIALLPNTQVYLLLGLAEVQESKASILVLDKMSHKKHINHHQNLDL